MYEPGQGPAQSFFLGFWRHFCQLNETVICVTFCAEKQVTPSQALHQNRVFMLVELRGMENLLPVV